MRNALILFIVLLVIIPFSLAIQVNIPQDVIKTGSNYSINVNNTEFHRGLTPQQVANLFDASSYYLKSNPFGFYNSTTLPAQTDYNSTGLILNWSDIISGGGSQTPWTSDIYAEQYDLYSRGDLIGIDRLVVKTGINTFAQGFYYQGEFNSKPYFFNGDASYYIFFDGIDSQWTISNSAPANGTSASITVGKSATMLGTYTYSDADTSIVQPNYGIFDDQSSVFIDGLITPVIKNYAGLDIFETENQIIRMADNTVAIRFSGVPDASDIMTLATDGSTGIRRFEFNNGIASGGIISVGTNDRKLYGTSGSIDPAIDWTNGYQIKFPAYTSNGLLKTTSGDGRIEVDTNTYIYDSAGITTALGFTPYSDANPNGYITSVDVPTYETDPVYSAWQSGTFNPRIDLTNSVIYAPDTTTELIDFTSSVSTTSGMSFNGQVPIFYYGIGMSGGYGSINTENRQLKGMVGGIEYSALDWSTANAVSLPQYGAGVLKTDTSGVISTGATLDDVAEGTSYKRVPTGSLICTTTTPVYTCDDASCSCASTSSCTTIDVPSGCSTL